METTEPIRQKLTLELEFDPGDRTHSFLICFSSPLAMSNIACKTLIEHITLGNALPKTVQHEPCNIGTITQLATPDGKIYCFFGKGDDNLIEMAHESILIGKGDSDIMFTDEFTAVSSMPTFRGLRESLPSITVVDHEQKVLGVARIATNNNGKNEVVVCRFRL